MQKPLQVLQVSPIKSNPSERPCSAEVEKTGPPNLGLAWLLLASGLAISIGSCNIHIALNM